MSSAFTVSYVLLWVLVVGQSVLVFVLLRTLGQVLYASRYRPNDEGIPVGERLPELDFGRFVARFNVLVLAQVDCEYCAGAVRAAEELSARSPAFGAQVVVATEELGRYRETTRLPVVGIARDRIGGTLKARVTPFVFVTDRTGTVLGKGVVNDNTQLEALLVSAGDDVRAALAAAESHATDGVPAASTTSAL